MKLHRALLLLFAIASSLSAGELIPDSAEQWPMASGPYGSWTVETENNVSRFFSVATGQGIRWKTPLPEGGQSGIAVWDNRIFLSVNKPLRDGTPTNDAKGTDIVAC